MAVVVMPLPVSLPHYFHQKIHDHHCYLCASFLCQKHFQFLFKKYFCASSALLFQFSSPCLPTNLYPGNWYLYTLVVMHCLLCLHVTHPNNCRTLHLTHSIVKTQYLLVLFTLTLHALKVFSILTCGLTISSQWIPIHLLNKM